jgi:hypothetical protein
LGGAMSNPRAVRFRAIRGSIRAKSAGEAFWARTSGANWPVRAHRARQFPSPDRDAVTTRHAPEAPRAARCSYP